MMLGTSTLALVIAVLLATPFAALRLRRKEIALTDQGMGARGPIVFQAVHGVVTLTVGGWLAWKLLGVSLDPLDTAAAGLFLGFAVVCLLLALFYPLAGPVAFLVLSYTFPREHAVTVALMGIGTMSWIAALSVHATVIWAYRCAGVIAGPRNPVVVAATAFAAWLAVAMVAAIVAGRPLDPELTSRSIRYAQALALFLVTAVTRPSLRDLRLLAVLLSVVLVLRQLLLTEIWFREQNLAMLAAIVIPVALALAFCRPLSVLQIPLAAAGLYLVVMVVFVQNRGALLGLTASFGGLVAAARARLLGLGLLVMALVAAGAWAAQAGLLDRFREIHVSGEFQGTAAERLGLWSAGMRLTADYPIFGVGPGNFPRFVGRYLAGREANYPHNSLVEVASETGLPGLGLYSLVMILAIRRLVAAARLPPSDWRRIAAGGLLGTIAAYLVTGFFQSNAPLVLMWVLLGVAASETMTRAPAVAQSESGA